MWIDSHTHIFCEEFDEDRTEVMNRSQEAGIDTLILPNIDVSSLSPLVETYNSYKSSVSVALGLHPTSVEHDWQEQLETIYSFASEYRKSEENCPSLVAIGEIGLDLYWDKTHIEEQRKALQMQIEWALDWDLPIILHVREAFQETFSLLKSYTSHPNLRGVFHSFTGNEEELGIIKKEFPNFFIGINGIATFKNSALRSLIPSIPLNRLLLETDAPYLAPVPKRGQRNEPSFLPYIGQVIGDIYTLPVSQIAQITSENAIRLFGRER